MPLPTKEDLEVALEKESNKGILELTPAKIKKEKNDILQRIQLPRQVLKEYHTSLKHYRYINSLDDVILGNFIRWINLSDPERIKLTNGAFVTDFKKTPSTIYIVCKNHFGRFFNIDINKCLLFQKLNEQEETLLAVINYLEK
ncbi:MAG: hypothetical protein ACR2M6_00460 [Vampirovibrionia bacterium]|jgi:hypothetical protein